MNEKNGTRIRMPNELSFLYKKAALYANKSMNAIILEALESRKSFIEKKYIVDVDREK